MSLPKRQVTGNQAPGVAPTAVSPALAAAQFADINMKAAMAQLPQYHQYAALAGQASAGQFAALPAGAQLAAFQANPSVSQSQAVTIQLPQFAIPNAGFSCKSLQFLVSLSFHTHPLTFCFYDFSN